MNVDIKIMASPKRKDMALSLANSIGEDESIIVFDDRQNGGDAMYTAKKTWKSFSNEYSHSLVLQDDVKVVKDFRRYALICAEQFPEAIFSFYCSRTKLDQLDLKSPYIKLVGDHCVAGGCAVMMPTSLIQRWLDWNDEYLGEEYRHDDASLGMFAQANNIDVFTTVPSLVQHMAPTKSLVGLNNYQKTSKVYIGDNIEFVNFNTNKFKTMKMNFPWCLDGADINSKAYNYMKSLKEKNAVK